MGVAQLDKYLLSYPLLFRLFIGVLHYEDSVLDQLYHFGTIFAKFMSPSNGSVHLLPENH